MIILDIIIIILIFIIVFMVLSGVFSLCERKILAIFQLRIGPALFLFGIITPITDGVKLFIKFILFIISIDILYLVMSLYISIVCMYFTWFFIPIGYILFYDINFSLLLLLGLHLLNNVFGIFLVGCFLFSSCFVYLAAMRALLFSILAEASISISLYIYYLLDFFSFFSIKDISINQLFINNFFIIGILFYLLFNLTILLDGLRIPFDYLECESELVAGLIVEMSGFFFVIYSLMEINHILISSILIVSLNFGGILISFKSLFILIITFLIPRAIGCRIKITTAQTFIILFLYCIIFLIFLWLSITKILTILN